MRRHTIWLMIGWLAAVAAVWAGLVIWDSYFDPRVAMKLVDHRFLSHGLHEGMWMWEEGPVKTTRSAGPDTQVVDALPDEFVEMLKYSTAFRSVRVFDDGIFKTMRFYPAENSSSEIVGPDGNLVFPPWRVFVVQRVALPMQWVPFLLFVISGFGLLPRFRKEGWSRAIAAYACIVAALMLIGCTIRSYNTRVKSPYGIAYYFNAGSNVETGICNGRMWFGHRTASGYIRLIRGWELGSLYVDPADVERGVAGFGFWRHSSESMESMSRSWVLSIPMWIPTALACVYPVLFWRRARVTKARTAANACRACGYDLRASRERCPECGAVAPSQYFSP